MVATDLAERYRHAPGVVRANMVMSIDGSTTIDGRVGPLTGAADQRVLTTLRELADVVVVGAGTVRAEGYGPLGDTALAVVSNSGSLDPDGPLFDAGHRPWLIVPDVAHLDPRVAERVEVIRVGDRSVDPAAALDTLAARGMTRILSEGGPSLLGQLLDAGLLDELCLTLSPMLVGTAGGTALVQATRHQRFEAVDTWIDDGFTFIRLRRAGE